MGSISRRRKKVDEEVKTGESIDRISNLPDAVLCHILSFLPTKYAVGTSILSTRWKYLFSSIPFIDLDYSLLLCPPEANENPVRETASFTNFVDRVLILCDVACIDRFRVKCGQSIDDSHVDTWICATLRRNIRELDLYISMKEFTMLPRDLFTCQSLVVLKLGSKFVLNVPIEVCLPNLKVIHLDETVFLDDDSIQRLISGCPVLEDLFMQRCGWKNIDICNIDAPLLKSLTIICLAHGDYGTEFRTYEIVLNAPNLVYLEYADYVPEIFSVKNLQSLVEAHIYVTLSVEQLKAINNYWDVSVAEILVGISKVQFLRLSDDFMELLVLYNHRLPTFPNVRRLEIGVHNYIGCRMFPDLLDSSPLLEALVFYDGLSNTVVDYSHLLDLPQDVPSCLLFHLKTIEIASFRGRKYDLSVTEYFLKNARVLKKMTIRMDRRMSKKQQLKVTKKLLMLSRGSEDCQVEIS